MKILKFGGGVLKSAQDWYQSLTIIKQSMPLCVVVSAFGKTTQILKKSMLNAFNGYMEPAIHDVRFLEKNLLKQVDRYWHLYVRHECDYREKVAESIKIYIDELLLVLDDMNQKKSDSTQIMDKGYAYGERIAATIMSYCGQAIDMPTIHIEASDIIKTDNYFGESNPDINYIKKHISPLQSLIESSKIPIIGGFYGSNAQGQITTLGYEGSDYTATTLGSCLKVSTVELWKNVEGIYTIDPNLIPHAYMLNHISYSDSSLMAKWGARILHKKTLKPIENKNINVYIKNFNYPNNRGTVINSSPSNRSSLVLALCLKNNGRCIVSKQKLPNSIISNANYIFQTYNKGIYRYFFAEKIEINTNNLNIEYQDINIISILKCSDHLKVLQYLQLFQKKYHFEYHYDDSTCSYHVFIEHHVYDIDSLLNLFHHVFCATNNAHIINA